MPRPEPHAAEHDGVQGIWDMGLPRLWAHDTHYRPCFWLAVSLHTLSRTFQPERRQEIT